MGSNTMSETLTHMFLFQSASNFEKWPWQPNRSVMAEYGRDGCNDRCWGTDLSLGAACLNDDMCSSRVCRDGNCVAVDQPLGSTCSKYDELCASNIYKSLHIFPKGNAQTSYGRYHHV